MTRNHGGKLCLLGAMSFLVCACASSSAAQKVTSGGDRAPYAERVTYEGVCGAYDYDVVKIDSRIAQFPTLVSSVLSDVRLRLDEEVISEQLPIDLASDDQIVSFKVVCVPPMGDSPVEPVLGIKVLVLRHKQNGPLITHSARRYQLVYFGRRFQEDLSDLGEAIPLEQVGSVIASGG